MNGQGKMEDKEKLNKAGWVAIQVSSFMDKLDSMDGLNLSYSLSQLDDLNVCKGIIRQLAIENSKLKEEHCIPKENVMEFFKII